MRAYATAMDSIDTIDHVKNFKNIVLKDFDKR